MTSQLERGFKAWAERTALSFRRELAQEPHSPIDPVLLAGLLDVRLWTPTDVPGMTPALLDQLLKIDPGGWSAASILLDGQMLVIYNPKHSHGRIASDIVHELAHIILDHRPGMVIMSQDGSMVMRSYDRKHEEEANWLAWSILLPRDALLYAIRSRLDIDEIAEHYGVSKPLVTFRLRVTGLASRVGATRHGRYGS